VCSLTGPLVPAAQRVLPAQTVYAWLAPAWSSLAQRAAALPFRGADAGKHAVSHADRAVDCFTRRHPLARAQPQRCRVSETSRGGASRPRSHG